MRDLETILAELNAAEKEYARKCEKYGIEEKGRKKKAEELPKEDSEGSQAE